MSPTSEDLTIGNRETGGNRGKPGQPQLTPWAAGIFPGPHYAPALQHSTSAGPGRHARLAVTGSVPSALGPATGRAGPGVGKKSAVPTTDPPFPGSIYSQGHGFLALGSDFGTENPASRTLSITPAKPGHRLFTFFLLTISTTYVSGHLLTPHPSLILVQGSESEIPEG